MVGVLLNLKSLYLKVMKKAIIVSGYFNPLHKGHIELFEISKQLCDMLIVIVNFIDG